MALVRLDRLPEDIGWYVRECLEQWPRVSVSATFAFVVDKVCKGVVVYQDDYDVVAAPGASGAEFFKSLTIAIDGYRYENYRY